jgi:hypothetical protein
MQGQLTALGRVRTAAERDPFSPDLWDTKVWGLVTGAVIVPLVVLWVLLGILL